MLAPGTLCCWTWTCVGVCGLSTTHSSTAAFPSRELRTGQAGSAVAVGAPTLISLPNPLIIWSIQSPLAQHIPSRWPFVQPATMAIPPELSTLRDSIAAHLAKHPKPASYIPSYGTAGFRDEASKLPGIMYRCDDQRCKMCGTCTSHEAQVRHPRSSTCSGHICGHRHRDHRLSQPRARQWRQARRT